MTISQSSPKKTLVFIDSGVSNYQSIVDALSDDTPWVLLDADQDGVLQMQSVLMSYSELDSIQVISHGSVGALCLGSTVLSQSNLSDYASQLQDIGKALTQTGDLLLYGCNVAQGNAGQAFIESIAAATQADVAASTNLTGNSALYADWDLESTVGPIEASSLSLEYTATLSAIGTSQKFNYNNALIAAEFSNAAYLGVNDISLWMDSAGWTPLKLGALFDSAGGYEINNAYGFAAKKTTSDGTVNFVLSFEGSNPDQREDWTTTNFSEYGWTNYYITLMPLMTQVIREAMEEKEKGNNVDILITGHSLGGAVASVAFADLFLNPGQNFWVESQAPLKSGSRIYDQGALNKWTDTQIHALVDNTSVYTFGAPSFLIDPTKPNSSEWAGLGLDTLKDLATGDWKSLFIDWGFAVADAMTVDNALIPNLTGIDNSFFQFEHEDSSPTRLADPVSSLGTKDAGTVLDIDLTAAIHDRYNSVLSLPVEHSMKGYLESIARVISGVELVKSDTPMANSSLLLPSASSGMSGNDRVLAGTVGSGGSGNDILIAQSMTTSLKGGSGQDAYVISDYGVNLTLSGPDNEKLDVLYFNLLGQILSYVNNEDLVLTLSSPSGQSSATITGWYSVSNNYQLSAVEKIRPIIQGPWDVEHLSFNKLSIPLFNIGTAVDDYIIGSFSADTMNGYAGNDTIDGRDGNDTIYGGDGQDQLNGGLGNDLLYGDANDDNLEGGDGADTLHGGAGNDYLDGGSGADVLYGDGDNDVLKAGAGDTLYGGTGNDQYLLVEAGNILISESGGSGTDEVLVQHSALQPISTRFTVSGNDLLISVAKTDGSNFSTLTIQNFLANPVEYLTINNNGQNLRYNLGTAWGLAKTGDSVASTAIIPSQSNWPWFFGTDGNDTINGQDGPNDYLRGYGGNDVLRGFGGFDQLYGMDGNDTLEGGDGNDHLMGGADNDTINISGNSGFDTVDGGSGTDTLNLDWSANTFPKSTTGSLSFSVQKADLSWVSFGLHGNTSAYTGDLYSDATAATVNNLLLAFSSNPVQFKYSQNSALVGYGRSSEYSAVTWKNLENINVTGGANSDFLVYQSDSQYQGNGLFVVSCGT